MGRWLEGFCLVTIAASFLLLLQRERSVQMEGISAQFTIMPSPDAVVLPRFRSRPEVAHVDCARIFAGDKMYTQQFLGRKRIKLKHATNLSMSCEAIRSRVIGPIPHPRLNFSIAFAKGVHTDYEFLEMGLATTYSPENHYCFAVDSKSTPEFQQRFRMLASCLPNVYLTPVKRSMTSAGAYVNRAHLDCLEVLIERPGWEYVILQQTYDFLAHSNEELMMMLKKLRGYNDIFACQPEQMLAKRIDRSLNWTAAGLNIFTKRSPYTIEQKKAATIEFGYGYVQATLGRKAVRWMTQDVNLTTFIDHITHNKTGYGVDEQFIATLALSETLQMPGGLHHRCGGKPGFGYFTRYTIWKGDCKTGKRRNGQCIWGVEDLPMLRNISSRYLMINKFIPDFDFLGIHCLSESIYNRTHMGPDFVNLELLGKHAIVYYNDVVKKEPGFNSSAFTCNITFPQP